MYLDLFFSSHLIFTTKELREYLRNVHDCPAQTVEERSISLISYHQKHGHILQIRRGLYYTVPRGSISSEYPVDPYLIAGKLSEDAVLAFNTALGVHGISHSMTSFFYYLTQDISKRRFLFQGCTYQPIFPDIHLRKADKANFGITNINYQGVNLRVTTLERTLVDTLHRPLLVGELEEIWLSLEGITYLNVDEVVEYTLLLSQSTVAAKVGFFLEEHKQQYHVAEHLLEKLRERCPKTPYYFQRKPQGTQKLIPGWNLIVPESLLKRQWEEPYADL
ncbi:MAG: hypothetical protein JSR46_05885 [Verrucomicrobia bacterium]|nr:hypothetical protein [Verrucomicrobiota bacterium]